MTKYTFFEVQDMAFDDFYDEVDSFDDSLCFLEYFIYDNYMDELKRDEDLKEVDRLRRKLTLARAQCDLYDGYSIFDEVKTDGQNLAREYEYDFERQIQRSIQQLLANSLWLI